MIDLWDRLPIQQGLYVQIARSGYWQWCKSLEDLVRRVRTASGAGKEDSVFVIEGRGRKGMWTGIVIRCVDRVWWVVGSDGQW